MPWEYIELILCRDIYHCTPSELYEQPVDVINMHLALIGVEKRVEEFRNQKSTGGK